jgi:hypothetical protein
VCAAAKDHSLEASQFNTNLKYINNTFISVDFFIISGVGLSPLGTAATSGLLYKPQMIDEVDTL